MEVYLLDGTYELFRHFFAVPAHADVHGRERGAVVGVLGSVLALFEEGVTHLGVATDHVIESFRNDLWAGYKTGAGIDPQLFEQFEPLEQGLETMGVRVWAMVALEADDALASAAARAAADPAVERVVIATPDKDLAQCVVDGRVVQLDRRRREFRDDDGVRERFGVAPTSIPDYLALVGDSADGFPGLQGWGAKSAATVLARYEHLEGIPEDPEQWEVSVRGAAKLAATLREQHADALLFRDLATLRTSEPVFEGIDELRWRGPTRAFAALAEELRAPDLVARARAVLDRRGQ